MFSQIGHINLISKLIRLPTYLLTYLSMYTPICTYIFTFIFTYILYKEVIHLKYLLITYL
jgi:hypothetical protein